MPIAPHILHLEAELTKLVSGTTLSDTEIQPVRRALLAALQTINSESSSKTPVMSRMLDNLISNVSKRREAAILLIRALSYPDVIPTNEVDSQIERKCVELIEQGAPDLIAKFIVDKKIQNYQKIEQLQAVHAKICSPLQILCDLPKEPGALMAARQDILKALNNKSVQAYLSVYDIKKMAYIIESMFAKIDIVQKINDHTFWENIDEMRDLIVREVTSCDDNPTFLSQGYYKPFLNTVSEVLKTIDEDSRSRFTCELNFKIGNDLIAERKYPFHEPERILTVQVPLINNGPGMAIGVTVHVATTNDSVLLSSGNINIGDIPPGEFSVFVEIMIVKSFNELPLSLSLTWGTLANADKISKHAILRFQAQQKDIHWPLLEQKVPYNTGIAEGTEFVGRREKVIALSNRLLKDKMQSSYITGQKRIGKSSLALAVRQHIIETRHTKNIHFLYLEYGEYACAEPRQTLSSLGQRIAEFLEEYLPREVEVDTSQNAFDGTLSPLSRIADLISKHSPELRFVVILDEFDEIPQELYRLGSLAETFFANLRTLSAKKNLAFMLVGGESMPFIVSAQGDQLNKFVRESLNSFSRSDEWNDFVELVTIPVKGILHWYPEAINLVFNLSNGHPYYAKLICAKVYSIALSARDTEVTTGEVQRAYEELVTSLDVNAFAHLWKDGIMAERNQAEVISLQRCRLLVAIGRVVRNRSSITLGTIKAEKHSPQLADHEIDPMLTDFCRRGILEDKGNRYEFPLILFQQWLAQSGINRLIADTLGDELAASIQKAEDQAYVKDGEIGGLIAKWSTYRGNKISVYEVRSWLNQVERNREQRFLYKLLSNIRFLSELEIREKLRMAHTLVLNSVPEFVRRSPSDRRKDILVTYTDGPAKSGSYYASRYAEENIISSECVLEMQNFSSALDRHEVQAAVSVNGLVIIDDIAGSGKTLSDGLKKFLNDNRIAIRDRSMYVVVVVLCATPEGEARIRKTLQTFNDIKCDLRICEPLAKSHYAFLVGNGIWDNADEEAEAKALCIRLGTKLVKNNPLGFDQQGLLVVFPNTCPNNTLPIFHHASPGKDGWKPLFPRPKN